MASCASWSFPCDQFINTIDWGMQGHDPQRTNCYSAVNRSTASFIVGPLNTQEFHGPSGGAFVPAGRTLKLINRGDSPIDWAAQDLPDWISLSASGGSIPAHGDITLTLAPGACAANLAAGQYSGDIQFADLSNGDESVTRSVSLTVENGNLSLSSASRARATREPASAISPLSQTYTLS